MANVLLSLEETSIPVNSFSLMAERSAREGRRKPDLKQVLSSYAPRVRHRVMFLLPEEPNSLIRKRNRPRGIGKQGNKTRPYGAGGGALSDSLSGAVARVDQPCLAQWRGCESGREGWRETFRWKKKVPAVRTMIEPSYVWHASPLRVNVGSGREWIAKVAFRGDGRRHVVSMVLSSAPRRWPESQ